MDTTITRKRPSVNTRLFMFITLWGCLFINGCDDFFEKDITNENILLVSPGDSIFTNQEKQTFAWETIEGASGYRLVIVRPNFIKPDWLVIDTLVPGNLFSISLSPGEYQWRVRGENSAYMTAYTTRTFIITIKEESDEEDQTA